MGYYAEVDATKLGFDLSVSIQVTLARQVPNAVQKFSEAILTVSEVDSCVQVTGDFDYLLHAIVKDVKGLDILVNDKLSKIEAIIQLKTNVILCTVKESKKNLF